MSIGEHNSDAFPVKTRASTTEERGISVVLHSYSNRYFLVISEADSYSVGTIVQIVKHQQSGGLDIGPSAAVYDISVQFGNETPELLLAARLLASRVNFDKPVLFGLALRSFNKEIFNEIFGQVEKLYKSIHN